MKSQLEKIISNSTKETKEVAEKLAKQILNKKAEKRAVVLALEGDLGAGKTTFVQGFAKGLGIKEKILSPTFVILKKFKITKTTHYSLSRLPAGRQLPTHYNNFYHIDCYRLKNGKDLELLGFKKIISDPKNIIAIEWPEKIKKILPKNILKIEIEYKKETKRTLTISGIIHTWKKN